MHLHSNSFDNGQPIPAEFALGASNGFGGNRNPHLAWSDAPEGTRSFALLCIDTDAPTDASSLAGKPGVEIPVDHVRGDFVHWAAVDFPAQIREIAAGSASDGVTKGGKGPCQAEGARQGLNDYTGWFADDKSMAGDYFGYDGPYPPPNDLRTHRYFFRIFALDTETLDVPPRFTAADVWRAMHGHVLAEASMYGTYCLHAGKR